MLKIIKVSLNLLKLFRKKCRLFFPDTVKFHLSFFLVFFLISDFSLTQNHLFLIFFNFLYNNTFISVFLNLFPFKTFLFFLVFVLD